MLKCFFLFKIISCTIIIIIMEQEFIFLWKEIFSKSGSCDWYRINFFKILKSCTILMKVKSSKSCFKVSSVNKLFIKSYFLWIHIMSIQWEALLNECFIIFQLFQTEKKSLQFLLHLSLVFQSIEKDFSQYWWRCNKVPSSEKVSSKF